MNTPLLSSSHPNELRTYFARPSIRVHDDKCHTPKIIPPPFYVIARKMLSTSMFFEVDLKCLHNNIIHKRNWNNAKLLKHELVVSLGGQPKKAIITFNNDGVPTCPSWNIWIVTLKGHVFWLLETAKPIDTNTWINYNKWCLIWTNNLITQSQVWILTTCGW
jgi:hypothetical protein